MADSRRVAAALQYQQSQQDPFDAVPVADAPGTVRVPNTLPMTWMDRLNNLSAGLGTGITNQLEGYRQMITDPIQAGKDIVGAVTSVAKNPALIAESLKAMANKAASGSQGLGEVVGENMTLNPRRLAMALSHPAINEITAYHGTPHRFPATERNPLGEFDSSKIGTGEGAQAYGHGIYLAESPDVAEGYRISLSYDPDKMRIGGKQINKVYDQINNNAARMSPKLAAPEYEKMELLERLMLNDSLDSVSSAADGMSPTAKAWFEKQVRPNFETYGHLYHVDLPDEKIAQMLDWNKPFFEQSNSVRKALLSDKEINSRIASAIDSFGKEKVTGASIHSMLSGKPGELEQKLRSLGIPGIKYLDAGSRDGGKGTRNFVIFPGEEKDLTILERK